MSLFHDRLIRVRFRFLHQLHVSHRPETSFDMIMSEVTKEMATTGSK